MSCACYTCISSSEVGMIERMGKFDRIADAGCHCVNPCTERIAGKLSLRTMIIKTTVDTKTKDNVLVVIAVSVMYQVLHNKTQDAFYRFSDPYSQINAYVSNVIRGQVPNHNLDDVFIIRDEIQKAVKLEVDIQMERFGYNIIAALITDIDPNDAIKEAMSSANTNARLRVAMQYKAEAEKIEIVKAAEADAEAKRLSGVGLAEQRKAAIMGLQSSVQNFQSNVKGVTSKEIMSLLLMNQYFDAIKDIATVSKGAVVFLPSTGGASLEIAEGMLAAGTAAGARRRQ